MDYMIIIDEEALKECIGSNIYQSPHFEAGDRLAKALGGDKSVALISPRLRPHWEKEVLYLLQSKKETGYLVFDSKVFAEVPQITTKDNGLGDRLLVFQRVCRFAIKFWNRLKYSSPAEQWLYDKELGIVFPFPKSKHTGFRVTIREGYEDRRVEVRHGTRHLFAFSGGIGEVSSTPENERAYKRAFGALSAARLNVEVQIQSIQTIPKDLGYQPIVLAETNHTVIRYQSYDKWLARLTNDQRKFVTSSGKLPQRVEGPAGTGKTLCLLLRAYFLCYEAEQANGDCKILFIAHSDATKDAIQIMFSALDEKCFLRNRDDYAQAIELCTLQEWCGKLIGDKDVTNAQYLDQDALKSKETRKDFIKQVVSDRLATDRNSLNYLSENCKSFFESENPDYVSELLQHEIGVMIKGRASEKLESYLALPQLAYCLPTITENDRRFVFSLYNEYQAVLNQYGVFDTDDIVLTALGRLDNPIWRRRRATEGFDAVILDETHLFNLNELSVFHYLLREPQTSRIIFSIDRSQAPGERGITTRMVKEVLTGETGNDEETKTQLIFRSAPEIVKLTEAITSAGASLFTTFENPLTGVSSVLLADDESVVEPPVYWECLNDHEMCRWAVDRITGLCNELKCPASDILLIAMTDALLPIARGALQSANMKCVEILKRGDLEAVQKGQKDGAVIFSHPDYVGGLEFRAVLIAGVDEGRVPPTEGAVKAESRHFLEFKACNRLYVAISRARLRVELFYSKERGPSKLLDHAIATEAIVRREAR